MGDAENYFNYCSLDLVIPNAVVETPEWSIDDPCFAGDKFLDSLREAGERTGAFFDEKLSSFLLVRMGRDTEKSLIPNKHLPANRLLSFFNQLQVSVEATYIPPSETASGSRLSALGQPSANSNASRPNGFQLQLPMAPPQTPSPVPSTTDGDKKYVLADGTLLKSFIWGEEGVEPLETFRFLWSERESCWIGLYGIVLSVAFVRTSVADPLLCLTVSITLREKAIPKSPSRQVLADLMKSINHDSLENASTDESALIPNQLESNSAHGILYEVNLLDGLSADLRPDDRSYLYLPSTRLPTSVRSSYSLHPVSPTSPVTTRPSPSKTLPVLRKSFRKTLATISGFGVRMRTVFIPHIYIPEDPEDFASGQDAASEESTVVLSVEIEAFEDARSGFTVDDVHVHIRGDGAKVRLIGWGEDGFSDTKGVLPLLMRPAEQYNLLYAVSFLRPAELDLASGKSDRSSGDFQRPVAITIIGRPFFLSGDDDDFQPLVATDLQYPTYPFLSRWNCVLDLSPRRNRDSYPPQADPHSVRNAMPFPMSPFPPSTPLPQEMHDPAPSPFVGSQRPGLSASSHPSLRTDSLPQNRSSSTAASLKASGRLTPLGIGRALTSGALNSPPLPPLPAGANKTPTGPSLPPQSSGYPTNDTSRPRPTSVLPSLGQMASVGLGVDPSRARMHQAGFPQTPGPSLPAGASVPFNPSSGDLIVSVQLMGPQESAASGLHKHIYPLDEFSLEIFVFNQSTYPRTLEATYPDKRLSKDRQRTSSLGHDDRLSITQPFTPLESQVRIGPLAQLSCQSVRMRFLAILPGIHSIDGLVLTDVSTGVATNLRSVMDFAILSRDKQL